MQNKNSTKIIIGVIIAFLVLIVSHEYLIWKIKSTAPWVFERKFIYERLETVEERSDRLAIEMRELKEGLGKLDEVSERLERTADFMEDLIAEESPVSDWPEKPVLSEE